MVYFLSQGDLGLIRIKPPSFHSKLIFLASNNPNEWHFTCCDIPFYISFSIENVLSYPNMCPVSMNDQQPKWMTFEAATFIDFSKLFSPFGYCKLTEFATEEHSISK